MKDEFVMVPRELAEVAGRALSSNGYDLQARDLEAALSLQLQGEPVAFLVHGPSGCMGAYLKDPTHWAHGYRVEPLYTLRAQLAEQDALLRRCLLAVREQHCDEGEAEFDLPAPLLSDIDAALSAQLRPADAGELERLRAALKFYADREHYHFESGNWDTVSGEPLNILWCGDDPDFIEDGSVARAALSTSADPSNDLCAEGAHEFVPFRSKCVKCGELYSAEPSAREAQALKDESRLGIERLPAEPITPDGLEGVEDLARRIAARVKARASLERKP